MNGHMKSKVEHVTGVVKDKKKTRLESGVTQFALEISQP